MVAVDTVAARRGRNCGRLGRREHGGVGGGAAVGVEHALMAITRSRTRTALLVAWSERLTLTSGMTPQNP